jgi:uncharacterized protein involved in outer membrane biogenesis
MRKLQKGAGSTRPEGGSVNWHRGWSWRPILVLALALSGSAEQAPAHIAGTWQISWEARLGTEQATIRFEQDGARLTGTYFGRLGAPVVSGRVEAHHVTFDLKFTGNYVFTIAFHGEAQDDKMSGKFAIQGAPGYEGHGENVTPLNYTWRANRKTGEPGQASSAAASDRSGP